MKRGFILSAVLVSVMGLCSVGMAEESLAERKPGLMDG